jgi:hypothetical protein
VRNFSASVYDSESKILSDEMMIISVLFYISLNTKIRPQLMMLKIQFLPWDRHKHVAELNWLMGSLLMYVLYVRNFSASVYDSESKILSDEMMIISVLFYMNTLS